VDYHPSVQQIGFVNNDTGECGERRLNHSDGEAERFYRELKASRLQGASGDGGHRACRWFERLLAELGFELWIGDPAQIKAKRVRKQKTDRLDAELLLQLLLEDRFLGCGYPVRKIEICVSCCGTGIGWCRCARGS
jgi:transposase